MNKEKLNRIINNDQFRLGLISFSILLLIFLSILFVNNLENKKLLINAIFLALTVMGAISGYQLTRLNLKKALYMGITRKQVLTDFVLRNITVIIVIFTLEIYYTLMYKWISDTKVSFWEMLEFKKIILLILSFIQFSFGGLIFGMFISKKWYEYLLLLLVVGLTVFYFVISVNVMVLLLHVVLTAIILIIGYWMVINNKF